MAFTTRRGRPPRVRTNAPDYGTPELRSKRLYSLTVEPIDLCLERQLITPRQHWCGLHLRWLYTLRYGAPSLTAHYLRERMPRASQTECNQWRAGREMEYIHACSELRRHRYESAVMRLAVYNELPAFLNPDLRERAWQETALAEQLSNSHQHLRCGLELLAQLWKHASRSTESSTPHL
jgi:hypothetical protein